MSDRDSGPAAHPSAALPSTSLALACVLHALPLGWAALMLPTDPFSWLALVLGALAALHALVAVLALARRPQALAPAWRVLSVAGVAVLAGVTLVVISSALYLSELYGGIGQTVSAAMFCLWGIVVLFTLPISAWGLARTVRLSGRARRIATGTSGATGLIALLLASAFGRSARAEPISLGDDDALHASLARALDALPAAPGPNASLRHAAPAVCRQPIGKGGLTVLVSALDRANAPFSACVQAADARALGDGLHELLVARGSAGDPATVDVIRAVQPLSSRVSLLGALSVRPALDGVCAAGRCLAPFQLTTLDAFTRYRPFPALKEASFGVSFGQLAEVLGVPADATLARIEVDSFVARGRALVPFVRMRPREVAHDADAIARGRSLAARHILAAQQPDGSFRYALDPYTGHADTAAVNLPRQAGTTLVLCELVGDDARDAVARALDQLARYERPAGSLSALADAPELGKLGQSALPLIAFAACRSLVGARHDALIGRLAQLMLAMQRADGSFSPELDLARGTPLGVHASLYGAGQAVLALVRVEQLLAAAPQPDWPSAAALREGIDRAMHHYARAYWPRPLRSLFYLEENWHCLAARAALASHRNDDYERFCLDYVAFKSRLVLPAREDVAPEHVGGYGIASMFPPHSTATAGFGEALAAALSLKHARGLPLGDDQVRMRAVLGFVLRQQWTPERCFVCADPAQVAGAFSESSISPSIRIDYVQHALAALGHGGATLALRER
ncbi:MAG: hypothetical protein ABW252_07440 [Polyangiales bacterium]